MLKINEENKKIWDDTFAQVPPTCDEDCCCDCCCCEDGSYKPAVPLGYDDDMKEYSAVKDLTEGAIKKRNYRCWKVGSSLVESFTDNPEELRLYDVLFLFTPDWEEEIFTVLLMDIDEEAKTVKLAYIDTQKDEVVKFDVKYTPSASLSFNDERTLNLDPK